VYTYEYERPVTSPYGSSTKSYALENSARVPNGTAPPRVSSKTRGAANMDRQLCFAAPLRDTQGWKSSGARRRGFATRLVTAKGWITNHCHSDAVS